MENAYLTVRNGHHVIFPFRGTSAQYQNSLSSFTIFNPYSADHKRLFYVQSGGAILIAAVTPETYSAMTQQTSASTALNASKIIDNTVIVRLEDGEVEAQKSALSAVSQYFRYAFDGRFREADDRSTSCRGLMNPSLG
jgi:hypothetical protein